MAVDERARHELYGRLEGALGPEATGTLMSLLPPVGWADVATRQDLDALGHRVDAQVADLRTELRTGMSNLRTEMAHLRTEMRTEMADLRTEVHDDLAGLGSDLRAEMSAGHRQLLFAMLGSMFTLTGLVWAVVTTVG